MVSGIERARTAQLGILGIPHQQCALGGVGLEIKCHRANRATDLPGSDEYSWPVEDECAEKFKLVVKTMSRLASRAEKRGTLPLANHPDGCATYTTRLACPAIDRRFKLKMARVAGSAGKIA